MNMGRVFSYGGSHWSRLPREVVKCPSLESLHTHLEAIRGDNWSSDGPCLHFERSLLRGAVWRCRISLNFGSCKETPGQKKAGD